MPSYIKSLKSNLGDLIIPRTTATAVTYDNSTSGLESINTQDAIDEMMGKGWISSDDSIPSDPAAINADSLGGLPTADYATNESVDNKISSLDADSVNSANKDLSNLSDYQKALHNIGGRPSRNFLRNAFFAGGGDSGTLPINQRGQKVYYNGSSIDGWKITGNGEQKVEVQSDGILLTTTARFGAYFIQMIDPGDLVQLRGKKVTLSSYLGDDTGFEGGMQAYIDGEYFTGISAHSNDINFGTFIVPETASTMYVQFGASGTGTCKAKACKLEEGEIQTLGWKDSSGSVHLFETSSYDEELLRCQYYYRRMYLTYLRFAHYDGTNARAGIPVQGMRVAPACSIIGTPSVYNSNNWGTVSVNLSVSAQPRPDDAKASDSDIIVVTAANAPSSDIVCNGLIVELSSEL